MSCSDERMAGVGVNRVHINTRKLRALAHDVNDFNLQSGIQLTIDNLDTASGGFIKSRIGEIPHSRRTAYPLILLS